MLNLHRFRLTWGEVFWLAFGLISTGCAIAAFLDLMAEFATGF